MAYNVEKNKIHAENLDGVQTLDMKKPKTQTIQVNKYPENDIETIIGNFQKCYEENKYRPETAQVHSKSSSRLNKNLNRNMPLFSRNEKSKSLRANSHSNSNSNHTLSTPQEKFASIKALSEEIGHIKAFCNELNATLHQNCIIENEKKAFDKIKAENIKLIADMNILKEDINEIFQNVQELGKRVCLLEEENLNLRKHNKNLVNYIGGLSRGGTGQKGFPTSNMNILQDQANNERYSHQTGPFPKEKEKFCDNQFKAKVDSSTPLSEISAFNSVHNMSSVELVNNVNNNIEKSAASASKKKRFLIPKRDEMGE